jgi:hypothetical protein
VPQPGHPHPHAHEARAAGEPAQQAGGVTVAEARPSSVRSSEGMMAVPLPESDAASKPDRK